MKTTVRLLIVCAATTALAAADVAVRGRSWFTDLSVLSRQEELRKRVGIDVDTFERYIDEGAIIVDARAAEKFAASHVDAISILSIPATPAETLAERAARYPRDQAGGIPIVLYCNSINCDEAEQVYEELSRTVFEEIYIYLPGWEGILKEKIPVTQGPQMLFGEPYVEGAAAPESSEPGMDDDANMDETGVEAVEPNGEPDDADGKDG